MCVELRLRDKVRLDKQEFKVKKIFSTLLLFVTVLIRLDKQEL